MSEQINDNTDDEYTFNIKILLLGEESIGKTSLILQFVDKTFSSDYKTTLGADFKSKTLKLENVFGKGEITTVNLQIWDVAGRARLSSYKKYYYPGTSGVLLVFDLTRRDTLTHLISWIEDVNEYSPESVKYLIGNKNDLKNERVVLQQEQEQFKTILGASGSTETSAKTGENVDKVFALMSLLILEKVRGKEGNSG
ncbi:MAG: Rab family GTPase [Candidatus Odinarchaeota archaeon]